MVEVEWAAKATAMASLAPKSAYRALILQWKAILPFRGSSE